jgi:FAD-linked oxidoreductase
VAPASEDELAELLKTAASPIRPVGAGHSFSALVPTDGTVLVLDRLEGLLEHDLSTRQATFGAGTRMMHMGPALERVGQGFVNMADIDRQTFAGAVSTSTHGTGAAFGSYSSYVTGIRLVTPSGDVLDLEEGDVFDAARVSLGALGVMTRIRIQNRESYRLRKRTWFQRTEELLEEADTLCREHRHFEMLPLVHSDYSVALVMDETDAPADPQAGAEENDEETLRMVAELPIAMRRATINGIAAATPEAGVTGASYQILANVRSMRFNEMEYQIPVEAGPDCLREILSVIADEAIDVVFPLEYRYIKGDDLWLSMFTGHDSVSISVHQFWDLPYQDYFRRIEQIFWKYEGRPHWGKLHTLDAARLQRLYPRWNDFAAVREGLDPAGKMLNPHLRRLFIS